MTSERDARDAVIARLNTLLAPQAAYSINDLRNMSTKPDAYVEVTVSRRLPDASRRVGSAPQMTAFRATTRAVGDTENNALLMASKAAGLEESILTIGGIPTPVDYETSSPVADDEGWFSGLTTWTFTV